ncbi:unnamed protein product [Pleuronectes platessa]|uniref:Uncharacterized protein n=1 Tax=Pleuronectes platessa TaxID=8262 RepID=A0A9N7W062_PLEPL|nr:unnamed protein product [Pleuronectes platessa]
MMMVIEEERGAGSELSIHIMRRRTPQLPGERYTRTLEEGGLFPNYTSKEGVAVYVSVHYVMHVSTEQPQMRQQSDGTLSASQDGKSLVLSELTDAPGSVWNT